MPASPAVPATRRPTEPQGAPQPARRVHRTTWLLAALVAPCSGCSAGTTFGMGALALWAATLSWLAWRERPQPLHRWDRHVALQLPGLAPERYCACGRCGQLAAPGAWLAQWHYEPPAGVLPPDKAPDAIPIQGIAWTFQAKGWEPAIVYVVANRHPDAIPQQQPQPPPARPARASSDPPSTNGHEPGYRLPDARTPPPRTS